MANELKQFDAKDIIGEQVDMKSYIEELVKVLRDDTEVYEKLKPLGLSVREVRENIGRLSDYQADYNVCKKCSGYDACPKTSKHMCMYVVKDGSCLVTRSEPCAKFLERARVEAKYLFKDFPSEWMKSTLKQLDLSENRRPVIKEFCDIVKGKSQKWIYVTGNHKVGKSILLVTFANEWVAHNKGQVAVINASNKFKELADIAFNQKEEFKNQISIMSKVPLLIIDGFGEEYKNEFIRDSIVIPVLLERNRNNLSTFFSSDFTIKEIQELYSIGKNGGPIRGKQLGKILLEMCEKEFDLTGASIYKK